MAIWQVILFIFISQNLQLQIYNLLVLTGLYFCWEYKIENSNTKKISRSSFVLSLVIILSVLIRGIYSFSDQDIFPYLTIPFLNIALIILHDGIKIFNNNFGIIFISFLVPIRNIILNFLEKFLVPYTSNLTWFNLKILGIDANISNNIIFFKTKGIRIADGCTGGDQIIFGLSVLIIFFILFPLIKKLNKLIMITIAITIPFIENSLRLSLLAVINSLDFDKSDQLFNFFHTSYGSILFTSITMFIISKSYLEFFKHENNFY